MNVDFEKGWQFILSTEMNISDLSRKTVKLMVPLIEKRKTCYGKQPFGYTSKRRKWIFLDIFLHHRTVDKWAAMSSNININPSSLCWEVASLHGWYATQSLHKHSQPCPDTLSVRQEPGTVYMCYVKKILTRPHNICNVTIWNMKHLFNNCSIFWHNACTQEKWR